MHTVRKSIEGLESLLIETHLHTCVPKGISSGNIQTVIEELVQLFTLKGNR